ncbi:hypothetical protein O6H91_04G064300 [Diphasiastrum complanatum]|uniref:Uncharacterized protein n=1 Tax=Diphasiastrum complanatum TaxID=34168 RepID=A0ACC2DXQ6_DIPCM|nr:hypothetical protein O6H91_04G064300 [Diphasiastrum complanatum]
MAEDAEKLANRSEDRNPFGRSPPTPTPTPTPTASSAGASFIPVQGNMASINWLGLGQGSKKVSLSGASVGLPRPTASTNTVGASTLHSRRSLCRPWDREDLLMRLSTFKSNSWFKKPMAISPMACARRGWANMEVDVIACDGCGAQLNFATASSFSQEQVENAAEIFSKQLETGHQPFCQWKGNMCSESLVQFPPTPVPALIGGYNYRCEALLQLPYLPAVSDASIDRMKFSRGPQIDCLLEKPPPLLGGLVAWNPVERMAMGSIEEQYNSFYKAQRLISLCGWEARVLPETPDCEDHSAHSARNVCSAGPSKVSSHKGQDCRTNVLIITRKEKHIDKKKKRPTKKNTRPVRPNPVSAFLDCSLCGVSVSLSSFAKVLRPSTALGSAFPILPQLHKPYAATPARGTSAASGIDGWLARDGKGRAFVEQVAEAGEASPAAEQDNPSNVGILDLSLTIAGGPPPTMLGAQTTAVYEPMPEMQALSEQPEGSEMGEYGVASYESRGPVDPHQDAGQGVSSICIPHSRTLQEASANMDHEAFETDDGEVGDAKSFAGESSKRKRIAESSAVDQFSLGMAVTGPASRNEGTNEPDVDCEVQGKLKRNNLCQWPSLQSGSNKAVAIDGGMNAEVPEISRKRDKLKDLGSGREGNLSRRTVKDVPCSSSVNATYTCYYNAMENSIESVECMPNSSDLNHTAGSGDYDFEGHVDKPIVHVQQSISQPGSNLRTMSVASHGFPINDRVGDEIDETNVAIISSGTGMAGGISVGMGVVDDQQHGSFEAEVRGETNTVDFSVHQAESPGGDPEVIINLAGHMGDFTPEYGLSGDFAPEEVDKAHHNDAQEDSHEAMLSLCPGIGQTSCKEFGSAEGEWGETGAKADRRESGRYISEWTQDTTNAVLMGGDSATLVREGIDGWIEAANGEDEQAGTNSVAVVCEDVQLYGKITKDFDPVCHHRHFCPWVNGNVVAAGSSSNFGILEALCGWQLTIDALDVLQMQGNLRAGVTESESTASMCKLVSDQQTPRSLSPKQQYSACGQ